MANAPDGDNGARTICVMSANEQTELVESHILTVPAHTKIVLEVLEKINAAYLTVLGSVPAKSYVITDSNVIAIDPCIMYPCIHVFRL